MYTLYYMPGACSLAVHTLLNEVNAPFTTVNVRNNPEKPMERPPEFLKINPRGNVPVLQKDGFVLREGAAILTTLADENKSPLLPATGNARATALEWLAFANSTLHPAYGRMFWLNGQLGDKAAENPLYEATIANIQKHWDDIEKRLSESDYLAGKEVTLADILVTVIANWSPAAKKPINFGPKTKALLQKISSRPAYKKAMESENVTYKVAA